jgi:hypothetical protein
MAASSQQDMDLIKDHRRTILHHYSVCDTPSLDLTHSLRVACSFAQLSSRDARAYVFVLGLPYTTNRISINTKKEVGYRFLINHKNYHRIIIF